MHLRGQRIARYMELRGRQVFECAGVLWHEAENRFLLPLPYQDTFDIDPGKLTPLLVQHRLMGARVPSAGGGGLPGGVYVRRREEYTVSTVHKSQRSRVRRGLERCEVREVDPEVLLKEGLAMNLGTMQRQARFDEEFGTDRGWKRVVHAVRNAPGMRVFGAFVEGRLAAYSVTCTDDGWLHLLHQNSSPDLLEANPNHALTFRLTEQAMGDPRLLGVCYGLMSVQPNPGLHEYKTRLGYSLAPHVEVYRLHPLIAPLLGNSLSWRAARALAAWRSENQTMQRVSLVIEGVWRSRRNEPASSSSPLVQPVGGIEARQKRTEVL